MGQRFKDEALLHSLDQSRRDFIKKVMVGSAFAIPVVNSFSMDGLKLSAGIDPAGADDKKGYDSGRPDKKTGVVAAPPPMSPS